MNAENLENVLASISIAEPSAAREARLLTMLRGDAESNEPQVWWRRPIPLWQAIAACVAVAFVDALWLRPAHPATQATPTAPVIVQVDGSIFENLPRVRAASDYSSWRVLSNR